MAAKPWANQIVGYGEEPPESLLAHPMRSVGLAYNCCYERRSEILPILPATPSAYGVRRQVCALPAVRIESGRRARRSCARRSQNVPIMSGGEAGRGVHYAPSVQRLRIVQGMPSLRDTEASRGLYWRWPRLFVVLPHLQEGALSPAIFRSGSADAHPGSESRVEAIIEDSLSLAAAGISQAQASRDARGRVQSLRRTLCLLRGNRDALPNARSCERRRGLLSKGARTIRYVETCLSHGLPGLVSSALLQLQRGPLPQRWGVSA